MSNIHRSFRLRDDQHNDLATIKRVEDRSAPSVFRLAFAMWLEEFPALLTKKLAEDKRAANAKRDRSEDGKQMAKCSFYLTSQQEKDMNTVARNTGLAKATQARDALDLYFRKARNGKRKL